MASLIESLVHRVTHDPAYVAHALAEYQQSEGLDDAALARALGCDIERLSRLRLCLRPRPECFDADIDEIATRLGVDADLLVEAVRRSDALQVMRDRNQRTGGTLMAARDRERDTDTDAAADPREPS